MEPRSRSSKYSTSSMSKSPELHNGIELMDLPRSPKFPQRTNPVFTLEERGVSDDDHGGISETTDSVITTSSTEKPPSKRNLFNMVSRRRTTSHSSDEDRTTPNISPGVVSPTRTTPPRQGNKVLRFLTPSKSSTPPSDLEAKVSTNGGYYNLAPKDASVLDRISKRAQHHSSRVRKPHEVFVELEELHVRSDVSDELEWEETARWIKFEEDVEEGSGRWGRPHVSALAFHSLVELRRGLEKGVVMLDVEGEDFPTIANQIVEKLISSNQLDQTQRESVLRILLKKHKHSNDITLWEKLKKSATDPDGTLHHIGEGLRRMSHAHPHHESGHTHNGTRRTSVPNLDLDEEGNPTHSDNQFKRVSSAPLLEMSDIMSPSPDHAPNERKVIFGINEYPTDAFQDAGFTNGNEDIDDKDECDITVNSDTKINVDVHEPALPQPGSESSLKRNKSVLSLMSKIPEEAESLTVLVGGVQFLQQPIVAFVRLDQSHLLGDLTEVPVPVRFVYLLLGPAEGHCDYHEVGRAMATLMSDAHFHDVAYSAEIKEDFLDAMDKFLDDSIVLPPGDWDEDLLLPIMHERNELRRRKQHALEEIPDTKDHTPDPLKHSRRPFGGIWRDFKNLIRRYPSDYKDAFHIQPFISIIFLYIAFIGPAIAFGGLMEEVTNNQIGVSETLLATGLCGIVYGLFSVQPLTILAFTGPQLLFETVIYRFAVDYFSISYIEWRAITSLWLMLLLVLAALSEISFLVKYFTRFSEEIFTGIICFFFIYEACLSIIHIFERNPLCGINYPCGKIVTNTCMPLYNDNYTLNSTFNQTDDYTVSLMMNGSEVAPKLPRNFRICNQPNTALWSTILCVFTFFIALFMRKLRHSKLFGKQGRRLVSDFGMLTAILLMVLLAYIFRDLIAVEVLVVPPNYATSNITRGWFINPFNGALSIGEGFGAIIPAVLLCTLIFIENQLTMILMSRPDFKLRKSVGYHFDLFIVAILTGVCGMLGIPWTCGAPIRSIQHLQALSVYSTKNPPGEKPKLLYIREQRMTTLIVHFMIILTPLAYMVLDLVPISVTLGVLFYLSYASLNGVQLVKRVLLLFTPPKHHPNVHYVRKVRTWKMHLYTIVQIVCVASLFGVKNSPAGMLYPVIIIALLPLKWVLDRYFYSHDEIEALDSEEDFPEDHTGHREEEFGEFEAHVPY